MSSTSKSTRLWKRGIKSLAIGLVVLAAATASAEARDGHGRHGNFGHRAPAHAYHHGHRPHYAPYRVSYYAPPARVMYAPAPVYHYPVHYTNPGLTFVLPLNIR